MNTAKKIQHLRGMMEHDMSAAWAIEVIEELQEQLEQVCNEVAHVEGHFYHPNAAGTPQYLEPEPHEMVEKALYLKDLEIKCLRAGMVDIATMKEHDQDDALRLRHKASCLLTTEDGEMNHE